MPNVLTREQREAVARIYRRDRAESGPFRVVESYATFRRRLRHGFDCVMLPWRGMWLGIEKDGYTHS